MLLRKVFGKWYWEVKELAAFLREQGLSSSGLKADLTQRVSDFLRTGRVAERRVAAGKGPRDSAIPGGLKVSTEYPGGKLQQRCCHPKFLWKARGGLPFQWVPPQLFERSPRGPKTHLWWFDWRLEESWEGQGLSINVHWFWVILTFWTIFKHLNPGLFGSLSHAWEMVMFSPAGAQWREAGLGCCKPEQMWMNIFLSSSTHFTNYLGLVKFHFDMLVGEMKYIPLKPY